MDTFWCILYIGVGLITCLHLTTEVDSRDFIKSREKVVKNNTNSLCNATCGPNYLCSARGKCLPKCLQKCGEYGVCSGENSCDCVEGYEWNDKERKCRPKCSPKCGPRATCAAPNKCVEPKPVQIIMRRLCRPDCGDNGVCGKNYKCNCESGYEWNSKKHRCQPTCSPQCGDNKVCIKPYTCECIHGYQQVNGTCQPVCSSGCGNHSRCVAPEKCACGIGFAWDEDRLKCVPTCNPMCGMNSFCYKHNHCKCHYGYKPDDSLSRSCSMPTNWWMYLLIGFMVLTILCCVGGIIIYFVKRSNNISYYPNPSFLDTSPIVS